MSNKNGPPPIGSAWSNTQELRVVTHTNGTDLSYFVQYTVYRQDKQTLEWRVAGRSHCNGTAWNQWVRSAQRYHDPRSEMPPNGGRGVGNQELGKAGGQGKDSAMAGRPAVDNPRGVVAPKQPGVDGRGDRHGQRLVHLAKDQQRKEGGQ